MRQTQMHTHDICAYIAVHLEVEEVNIAPFENVLRYVWHIYLLVWLYTHMSVCTCMCVYMCA